MIILFIVTIIELCFCFKNDKEESERRRRRYDQ